jgi:hypothetical protein
MSADRDVSARARTVLAHIALGDQIRIDDRGAHPREQLALMVTSRRAALRVRWEVLHSRFRLFFPEILLRRTRSFRSECSLSRCFNKIGRDTRRRIY